MTAAQKAAYGDGRQRGSPSRWGLADALPLAVAPYALAEAHAVAVARAGECEASARCEAAAGWHCARARYGEVPLVHRVGAPRVRLVGDSVTASAVAEVEEGHGRALAEGEPPPRAGARPRRAAVGAMAVRGQVKRRK